MYRTIWDKISQYDTITIFGHVIPDGDCYGSQLGLKNAIKENFPNKKVYALGSGIPKFFSLIGEMDKVDDEIIKSSLAIVVDTANLNRIEDQRYSLAREVIKIDHHLLQDHFGEPEVILNDKISCTQIIGDMLISLNIPFGKETALPLFLGLVTDSGRFLYQPISENAYRVAGALSMAFNCTLMAPHGGIFVFAVVGNWPFYLLALAVGSLVGMLLLGLLKKKVQK